MPSPPHADFWAVFDAAPDAYLLLAADSPRFTMIAANRARLQVTMTREEGIVGRPLFEVFPDNPTDPAATGVRNLRASLEEVIRTCRPHRMPVQKYDIRMPDGRFEERYWDALNSPVVDDSGKLVYLIHRVQDVTEQLLTARRLAQEAAAREEETRARRQTESVLRMLRDSEARYRLLTDMIPQHIWTTDPDGYHGYFSRRWYDFTGATFEETKGEGWLQFVHPDDRSRTVARWHHSLQTGEPYSIEYRFRRADGEYCWFLGQATALRDANGTIIEWFGTLTEISERKRLDAERDRAEEERRESEERFRALAENATVAIFVINDESTIVFANPAVERIFGYSQSEMLGRSLNMLMPENQRSQHDAGVRRYLETGQRRIRWEGVELPGFTKDGRIIPLEISMGEFEREGRHYFTGIARDISERKQAEEAMRESEERFRTLGNSIPQLAWMADPSGWIFWYNDRWYEYTGTTFEDMQGWGWQKVQHPAHVERVVERIRHAFETATPWEDKFPLRSRTGGYRWFLSRALPIRDARGGVVRWFGTNTDITAEIDAAAERERYLEGEREARAEAEERREELERVTESRTRLMRGFTHDVKNPLGAADGYAQLLEDGVLGELSSKQTQSVRRIRTSIQASLHLINELLELARAEAGLLELESEAVNVTELVREIVEDFRAQASSARLGLEVRAVEALPARTDPIRVRQILSNLLSNAVKYTPEGRITVEAGIRAKGTGRQNGECIAIAVSDTGPGIPADKQEVIFQEFSRLDPEAQHGAGVGLAISRRIARILGGDITVASEVNRGSTFTLWLPQKAVHSEPDVSRR